MNENVTLSADDIEVLTMIRGGHSLMSELVDFSGWVGEKVNRSIEVLDENRYIARRGYRGADFWAFAITQKGLDALPPLSGEEAKLFEYGLTPMDIRILKLFNEIGGEHLPGKIIQEKITDDVERKEAVAAVLKLLRMEYLNQMGFIRRRVSINELGKKVLVKVA